jgi:hypothetical protein
MGIDQQNNVANIKMDILDNETKKLLEFPKVNTCPKKNSCEVPSIDKNIKIKIGLKNKEFKTKIGNEHLTTVSANQHANGGFPISALESIFILNEYNIRTK